MKKRLFTIMAVFVLASLPAYAGPEQDTTNALTALENHILGTPTLSGTQIAAYKATIDTNQALFGTDSAVITAGFSLVETYDTQIGALWVLGSPIQSIDRNTITDSDIEWSVWNVMQYIMDYTYTTSNVGAFETDLNGKLFGCSADFPGSVDPAAQRTNNYSVDINADYPDTVGWPRFQEGTGNFSRKPTGTYAAPGDIVEVTVPASMVNQGYRIRVGCHSWDFETSDAGKPKNPIKRLDRVSLVYDITSATTKVANPLGGGIYIEVPFGKAGKVETIQITGAVRSPFFSINSVTGNNTTVSDWQNTERNNPAPWADFQSQKFMMNVPTDWIYALDRPDELMADWDSAMDIYNDLMGFPHIQGRESSYFQVDVSIRGGAYYPGWPQCNVSYNPDTDYGGLSSNYLISGPRLAQINIPCHEDGHGYLFPKFPGEVESTVNLGCVPILNLGFGYDLDYAFAASLGQQGNPYRTLDHTAMVWMTSFNFVNDAEMGEKEKKYQLPGHAKFVDIARIFGWQVLNDYFKSFVDYYEATGIAKPFDRDTDEHMLRLSIAADCDLTPLLYFWGIHPDNAATLAADIAAANLTDSTVDKSKIYNEIYKFGTLVPANNAEFQEYASSWWGRVPRLDATDQAEREDAQQWDTYDESSHDAIIAQINKILAMCFPGDVAECVYPFDGQQEVSITTDLLWNMVTAAVNYDVYLGTNYNAVLNATPASPEYQETVSGTTYTPTLQRSQVYYWRIDTNTSGGTITGTVCSFMTRGRTGNILWEVWDGISGTTIPDLTSSSNYPDTPDITDTLTLFEAPVNRGDNYGTRIHGYLIPPTDGDYTFWIASDDNGELWLSTDDNPANAVKIATVPGWSSSRQWDKFTQQQSVAITLVGNKPYYIMALQKESGGGDNLAVAWSGPGLTQQVIDGAHLVPYGLDYPLFNQSPIIVPDTLEGYTYSNTIAGTATAMNDGAVTYSKADGPLWLNVSPDGTLSGVPGDGDIGSSFTTIRATDNLGRKSYTDLSVNVLDTFSGERGLVDFAGLASHWSNSGCSDLPPCGGADLSGDNTVNLDDLAIFGNLWLIDKPYGGPVSIWPFDTDASDIMSGYDGTLMNGALIDTSDYAVGTGALSLDGVDDYVEKGVSA